MNNICFVLLLVIKIIFVSGSGQNENQESVRMLDKKDDDSDFMEIFKSIDSNRNEWISENEWNSHISQAKETIDRSDAEAEGKEAIKEYFNDEWTFGKIDRNTDNKISFQEYKEALVAFRARFPKPNRNGNDSDFMEIFKSIDSNNNEWISENEWNSHISQAKETIDATNAEAELKEAVKEYLNNEWTFGKIDRNTDNKISFQEYKEALVAYRAWLAESAGRWNN